MKPNLSRGKYPRADMPPLWDNTHMTTVIAANLLRLRKAARLDAKTLSRLAGLGATYVRDIEDGRTQSPTLATLTKLAQALRVPLSELTGTPGLAEGPQPFVIPTVNSDLATEFGTTQERVAAHLRTTGRRFSQAEIARHSLEVWQALQDLPARMTFDDRLEFTMAEFRSRHPGRTDPAPSGNA